MKVGCQVVTAILNLSQKAIFLDRDGTLNRNVDYLSDFKQLELLPGVETALLKLQSLSFRLFVASNQSGIARGLVSFEAVQTIHNLLQKQLLDKGIHIEEFAFCPHHPQGTVPEFSKECFCRKPKPGMLLSLAGKYNLDLGSSFMVGDMYRDAEAGLNAGTAAILVKPDANPQAAWDRVDNPRNLKEFVSLLDFADSLKDFT
jgi:D-glycero-D-manno-heptose 1,7-bisphosphate phosphatase